MRPKDKPGTFRIVPKDGRFRVSGTMSDGERVRFTRATRAEAESVAASMFGTFDGGGTTVAAAPLKEDATDDWGLPLGLRVSSSMLSTFAPKAPDGTPLPSMGPTPIAQVPPPVIPGGMPGTAPTPKPVVSAAEVKEKQEKVDRKRRRAESLAGLIGMGGAWGSVYTGRKWCESNDQLPVRPDPKQTNEMADSIKDGITETFGDREVGPWTMALLLGIAIPISMKLQSRKLTPEEIEERDKKRKDQAAKLRSVP